MSNYDPPGPPPSCEVCGAYPVYKRLCADCREQKADEKAHRERGVREGR